MKRNVGIDYLKALSIEFVLILHVGGFFKDQFVDGSICKEVDLIWHILEAIAYPAIHIFVLISCYFWIEKTPSKRGGIKVWLQTFIICVGGLLVAIFFHVPFEIGVLFPIFLPFSGRAYWFVTDYLFLLIIAPLLKNAIKDMNDVVLKRYTFFLFIINSFMCFLFRAFAWDQDYSNIGLFICLFFLCALINRNIENISRSGAICILFLSIMLMVASYITMKEFGTAGLTVFEGKEEFFYSYNCPIVIIQACSIFIVFLKGKYRTFKGLSTITGASLVVYLIHMHPIFKQQYVNYNLLKWMSTKNSLIYVCQVLLLTLLIYLLGILLSFPVLFISRKMTEKICGILKIN